MKKFNSIKQLHAEKDRLNQQQKCLEEKLFSNAKELKECLRPVNIAKDTLESMITGKATINNGNLFRSSLNYGVGLLARKIAGKTVNKLFKNIFSHSNN